MPYPKIIRNRYRVGETDNRQHSSYHHEEDMRDFHLPLAQLHQRHLHTWGICAGLEVSGAPGGSEITVQPGVAIDADGRMIVLADDGLAQTRDGALVSTPVLLKWDELSGLHYVTLRYAENEQPEQGDTTGRTRPINVRQVPLVQLEAARGFVDNGLALILAAVQLDDEHHLLALQADTQMGGARRSVGQALTTMEVRRSVCQVNPLSLGEVVTETTAGAVAPLPSGGLHFTVAHATDQIAFSTAAGDHFAGLQLRATETQLHGNLTVQGVLTLRTPNSTPELLLSIAADSTQLATATNHPLILATAGKARLTIKADGNIGVGTAEPQYNLDVHGTLNVRELYLNGALLTSLIPAPSQWTTLAGADGIAYTSGNVGIGTTAPTQRLDVNGTVKAQSFLLGTKPVVSSQWNSTTDGIHYLGGRVGIDTDKPAAPLHVATYMAVGPFSSTDGVGGIDVTGPVAELGFVRRDLAAWPAVTKPGDRFVWYNPEGTARLWTNDMGDLLTVSATGNVGIGTTAPNARLTVDDPSGDTLWNTAAFHKAALGPWWSHIHWGSTGDWYIRSASSEGTVYLQDNNGYVRIGGNRTGIFMALNDDLWFSDPQNGTIHIRNHNDSGFGQMVGHFRPPSSIEYKTDVAPLNDSELAQLLTDTLKTNLFLFRYKGDSAATRLRVGVIAEESPVYILGDEGKSLSTAEYLAMLHGAIKSLAQQVAHLTAQQSDPAALIHGRI